jgi:Rad3-related DNA helicase
VSKYQVLADDVAFVARSLGLGAYVKECQKCCTNNGKWGTYWRVTLSGDFSDIPFLRVQLNDRKQKKSVVVTGLSVELLEEDEFYGFTLDGDHLYHLDDFTITHNSGKSAIARALQVAVGADILTPSNILIEQYINDYPGLNFLKGKKHYRCAAGVDCKTWSECGQDPCENCPYQKCKTAVLDGVPTAFNPMSLYFTKISTRYEGSNVIVIDEAHQLASMMLVLCSKRLRKSDYRFPKEATNEVFLVRWLKEQIDRLDRLAKAYHRTNALDKLQKAKDEIESLSIIRQALIEQPENFCLWISKEKKETYLNIKPLFPPRFLMDRLVGGKKVILMSGTLFDYDIKNIVGDRPYLKIDQPSPIPVSARKIKYVPAPFKINFETDPKQLVAYIEKFIPKDGSNTLIHSTYSMSKRIASSFNIQVLSNTPEDKIDTVNEFKSKGGVFLASGCAEGLDLKYDLCRTNIIPKLAFPNLMDPSVQKRKALSDGESWYNLETLKSTIQAAGRSTRAADDFSTTYILDPSFKRLVLKERDKLPKSFLESIEGICL